MIHQRCFELEAKYQIQNSYSGFMRKIWPHTGSHNKQSSLQPYQHLDLSRISHAYCELLSFFDRNHLYITLDVRKKYVVNRKTKFFLESPEWRRRQETRTNVNFEDTAARILSTNKKKFPYTNFARSVCMAAIMVL